MLRTINRALQKARGRGGFSLAEMLVATLIVSMLAAVGTLGTSAALRSRADMIQSADAMSLASTAAQVLANEVRYGQEWELSNTNTAITLNSATYGSVVTETAEGVTRTGVTLELDDGRLVVRSGPTTYQILSDAAYDGAGGYQELRLADLAFSYDAGANTVKISFSVEDTRGNAVPVGDTEFTVTPLNPMRGAH